MPLSTEEQGWDFVESDLNFAGEHLKKKCDFQWSCNEWCCIRIIITCHAHVERWAKAKAAAEEVINSKLYSLVKDNYVDAFKSNSSEAIWEYDYNATNKVYSWDNFYAPGGDKKFDGNNQVGGLANPTQEMVESYEYATTEVSPIGLHGIQQKVRKKILHTANWNHAFKLLYSIMEPHGKVVR
ncbi:hypothetical protein NXU94_24390 [Bacteroides faecis]|uniref:hypothetical protein n=1 Tax=Bacteroides faecis TaxID=674529 RepID=UPI0021665EB4|nr:hypothetical protein [Bacteroides faecis]MCS3070109.1 hypothetical protein [Bacteroides faecis]